MTKLLLLLALLSVFQVPTKAFAFCETYEPNCDGQDQRGDNDDSDNDQDERPSDPDGPDYVGNPDEI